jgi:acyl-CoA synthetase (AMP-forming)/AMP-acid ligase II
MIFKSTTIVDIPVKGVYQALIDDANINATFIDGTTDERLTHEKLRSDSKKLAAGLIDKAGFKRGDVLAIFSPNQVCHLYISQLTNCQSIQKYFKLFLRSIIQLFYLVRLRREEK